MRTERNILIAFLLNFIFSIVEFVGGIAIGSVSIISDSVHDFGDAISVGIAYFLEKKSKQIKNGTYTYGYLRYSVLGSMITTAILICGSIFAICNAANHILNPVPIRYDEMIVFAIIGVAVNLIAAKITVEKGSMNQKAVNMHMIEDVAGWIAVLFGAVVMKVLDLFGISQVIILDPVLSIAIAIYIMINAIKHMKKTVDVFLEKSPQGTSTEVIKEKIKLIAGVIDVHHIHIWSLDGTTNCATMHVVVKANHAEIKKAIRAALSEINIHHTTLELESQWECCDYKDCQPELSVSCACGHNH
jgi:cobalt-zinc-cadmium efflux system protein